MRPDAVSFVSADALGAPPVPQVLRRQAALAQQKAMLHARLMAKVRRGERLRPVELAQLRETTAEAARALRARGFGDYDIAEAGFGLGLAPVAAAYAGGKVANALFPNLLKPNKDPGRLATNAAWYAAAIAGDAQALENLRVHSVVSQNGSVGWGSGKAAKDAAAKYAAAVKQLQGNRTQAGAGPTVAAPGSVVQLPDAGSAVVPPILQGGASATGPNQQSAPGYGPLPDYFPGGDTAGAPPVKLADMFGGQAGLLVAGAGLVLTLSQLFSDRRR
jgi:hypothetical protein